MGTQAEAHLEAAAEAQELGPENKETKTNREKAVEPQEQKEVEAVQVGSSVEKGFS